MRKIRVLHVNKFGFPWIGGVESHVHLVASELHKRDDYAVEVLACNTGVGRYRLEHCPYPLHKAASIGKFKSMSISFQLPRLLRRLNYDIVHFHHPFPLGELAFLRCNSKAKCVVTWHSDIIRQKHLLRLYHPFLLRFLERADLLLPTSTNYFKVSQYLERFREKCRVLPLGIDTRRFKATPDTLLGAEEITRESDLPPIVFVGRLVPYKGLEYLIKAMRKVQGRLCVIGDGSLLGEYRKMVRENKLEEKIDFLTNVSDERLVSYYYASKLVVLPSISVNESFGLVQLEAMCCGKPVVSTNLPTGVTYVNLNGQTGLTVPRADADALAAAINRLLENPEEARRLGKTAQERVLGEFDVSQMLTRLDQAYRSLFVSN